MAYKLIPLINFLLFIPYFLHFHFTLCSSLDAFISIAADLQESNRATRYIYISCKSSEVQHPLNRQTNKKLTLFLFRIQWNGYKLQWSRWKLNCVNQYFLPPTAFAFISCSVFIKLYSFNSKCSILMVERGWKIKRNLPTTSISPETMAVWKEGASTDISHVNLPETLSGTATNTTLLWLERFLCIQTIDNKSLCISVSEEKSEKDLFNLNGLRLMMKSRLRRKRNFALLNKTGIKQRITTPKK